MAFALAEHGILARQSAVAGDPNRRPAGPARFLSSRDALPPIVRLAARSPAHRDHLYLVLAGALEDEPFSTYQQTMPNGTDPEFDTPDYEWSATLPDKSGKHIIYSVWERSDSPETFYGCADVNFDGGNGEVIGIGSTPPTSTTTTTAPSTTSTTAPSTSSTTVPSTSSTTA